MRRILLSLISAFAIVGALVSAPAAHAGADPTPVTVTVAADRTTLDPDNPTAKITGRVTATRPGETEHPLAGRSVKVRGHWAQQPPMPDAITDDQGYFAATLTAKGAWSPVVAEIAASGEYAGASAQTETITVRKAPTRVTISSDQTKLDRGVPFTLRGLVEWESSRGWEPLDGATVKVWVNQGCPSEHQWRYPQTGADGRYVTTVAPVCSASARASVTHSSDLYETSETAGWASLGVRPAVNLEFYARLDPYGKVDVNGAIQSRDPDSGKSYAGQRIDIEYSPNGTRWRKHKTLKLRDNGFRTTFNVGYSGYWRARYAGGHNGMPGVSPKRRLWRWGTRMTKMKVSPSRVRVNGFVTASGTLTRYYSMKQRKPSAFKGQNVRIIFRFKGKKTWYHLGWDKTDRKGRFVKRVRAYGDAYFAAVFHGTKDTWSVGSPNTPYVDTYGSPRSAPYALPGQALAYPPLADLLQPGSPSSAAFIPLN